MTHTFNLQHNSSSQLGITSPVPQNLLDNALVDLASDQNYTATDATCPAPVNAQGNPTAACFSAGTNSGNSINWQLQLQYATSGGYGQIYDPNGAFLTFTTTSGQAQNHVYQNEGGRLTNIIASTTASDGSTVKDCTTAYIEGPAGGIHNSNITNQLASTNKSLYPGSYPNSRSFPSGGTLNLMAQVVVYESSGFYSQFAPPPQPPKNVDLYKLFANSNGAIAAKWPIESQLPGESPTEEATSD